MRVKKKPSRFEMRVSVEREVLSAVNGKLGESAPLFGMTRAAMEQWHQKAAKSIGPGKAEEVYRILLEISRRAELLSDQSRDVFSEERIAPNDDKMLALLNEKLSSL